MKHISSSRIAWALVLTFASVAVSVAGLTGEREEMPVATLSGQGGWHHAVSTNNIEAQRYFDEGLILTYAFNHEDAVRAFKVAAKLDPQLAMAYWGVALVLGPNINSGIDSGREKKAHNYIQKALAMMSNASDEEKAYIKVLAKRYSNDPRADWKQLDIDYKNAMHDVMIKFPEDPDAAVLYAESVMDLNPWKLWTSDGKPIEGTEEIVSILEDVLKRFPEHPGANHYYIHAVEASPHPERALPSARRLETLVPEAGHLLHLPAHIYMRVGDYAGAMRANLAAIKADSAYLGKPGFSTYYFYYLHDLHFYAVAASMAGDYVDAARVADLLAANMIPIVKESPDAEGFMPVSILVRARFHKWSEILSIPEPNPSLHFTTVMWLFARGEALAGIGRIDSAKAELLKVKVAEKLLPSDVSVGLNGARRISRIAEHVLNGRIALSEDSLALATEYFRQAVATQDSLGYDEPESWFLPAREESGGTLLLIKNYVEAASVFRADLVQHPRNPRSLLGLSEALVGQGKSEDAKRVRQEFDDASNHASPLLQADEH